MKPSLENLLARLRSAKHYQGQAAHHVRVTRRAVDAAILDDSVTLEDIERMVQSHLAWLELERAWRKSCGTLSREVRAELERI